QGDDVGNVRWRERGQVNEIAEQTGSCQSHLLVDAVGFNPLGRTEVNSRSEVNVAEEGRAVTGWQVPCAVIGSRRGRRDVVEVQTPGSRLSRSAVDLQRGRRDHEI